MIGTLYGLGVGPGDPDLITVKAREVLRHASVIAYPAPEGANSLVRAIADPHVPTGRIEIVIEMPMAVDRFPAQSVYDRYSVEIAGHLSAGRDVAVLCEGDPFLYGSYSYLHDRLADRFPARVIPGVSSLAAIAAAAGQPLALRNQILDVIPAPLSEATLAARLRSCEAAVVLKLGRHLPKVRGVLRRLGLEDSAVYVERATMTAEKVVPLAQLPSDVAPYFSAILVQRAAPPSRQRKDVPDGAAVVALTARGLGTARRIADTLPGAIVQGLNERTDAGDNGFSDTALHLKRLFSEGRPIVGVMAAAILIRSLGPVLGDKRTEPPVLAVAEDGSTVVPLLGGHHGANELARHIAAILGTAPAITTSGDIHLGFSLDAPPTGWYVHSSERVKSVTAALLAGNPVALQREAGDIAWLCASGIAFADTAPQTIVTTHRSVHRSLGTVVLHPPVLAVGVGCERGVEPSELIGLVRETLRRHDLAAQAVACVVSLDRKADEPAVHVLAAELRVPARFFSVETLSNVGSRLANPSTIVERAVGCPSVAEASALAAAGPGSDLVVAKTKSARATCAIALSATDIDPRVVGYPQGRLTIVGIGPGSDDWRTPEATAALSGATDVVGYRLYLDLVAHLIAGKRRHDGAMAEEEARCRLALDLAAAGKNVALISSGDAGVYGMAALVFELLERENNAAWGRVDVSVIPGLSAAQAAAARSGAPLGHDFCLISLSDLLTPWPVIEQRLKAAADGDFVVGLYNPVSRRRRTQLTSARDILLAHRPPDTPVILARNVGREGETVRVIALGDLTPEHADMLTIVLIGSSTTRAIRAGVNRWVYTPRGYAVQSATAEVSP